MKVWGLNIRVAVGPVTLLASKSFENRSEASKAEAFVKKLPKSNKLGFFK